MDNLIKSRRYTDINIESGYTNHHKGFFVKEARLNQGYTLEEVSKNICTASYLSKIESGVATPNKEMIEKLKTRLIIKFPKHGNNNRWVDMIRTAIYHDDLAFLKKYQSLDCTCIYQKTLVNFFIAVLDGDYRLADSCKKFVDKLESHFLPNELQFYYLFLSIHYWNNGQAKLGFGYARLAFDISRRLGIDDPYLFFNIAKYYFQIENLHLGFSYLEKALVMFKDFYATKWIVRCELLLCKEKLKVGDFLDVEERLDILENMFKCSDDFGSHSDLSNVKGMFLEYSGDYDGANRYYLQSLEQSKDAENECSVIGVVRIYFHQGKFSELRSFVEGIDAKGFRGGAMQELEYYYFKSEEELGSDFIAFLRKDAIPQAIDDWDLYRLEKYAQEMMDHYERNNKYKAAVESYRLWVAARDNIKFDAIMKLN